MDTPRGRIRRAAECDLFSHGRGGRPTFRLAILTSPEHSQNRGTRVFSAHPGACSRDKTGRNELRLSLPTTRESSRLQLNLRYALSDNVKASINTEKRALVEPAVRDAKRMKNMAKQVEREANQIRHELKALPKDSNKGPKLLKALKLCSAEFELMVKRMERSSDQIKTLHEKAKQQLLPSVTDIYTRVEHLEKTLTRALWTMTVSSVGARTLIAMPYVIAFGTTLTVDRMKSVLDPLAVRWAPKEHDLLLLAFFVLQVFLLTPITTRWNARLCWRSFDRMMGIVRKSELFWAKRSRACFENVAGRVDACAAVCALSGLSLTLQSH
jgi:hypothetical protein